VSGRGASGAVLSEWAKPVCRPVHLLEVDFDPFVYMTDAGCNVDWNNNVYVASRFLGFSPISETSELLVNRCTVSLSGVDQSVVALLLQETYFNRRMRIRLAMLNENLLVINSPVLIFDGRMSNPVVSIDPDTGAVACSVDGVSRWADFERTNGRHTNHTEQQALFPGDMGFRQVLSIPEKLFWNVWTDIPSTLIGGRLPRERGRR
jgi:hypothetical protein